MKKKILAYLILAFTPFVICLGQSRTIRGPLTVTDRIQGYKQLEFDYLTDALAFGFTSAMDGARVKINGYNAANDGNFGPDVYWDASSTASADGLTVFDPSVAGNGRLVREFKGKVNILWGGAIPDDSGSSAKSTNVTVMNAAIAAFDDDSYEGGTIFIPSGKWYFTSGTVFKTTNLSQVFEGEGSATSILVGCGIQLVHSITAVRFLGFDGLNAEDYGIILDDDRDLTSRTTYSSVQDRHVEFCKIIRYNEAGIAKTDTGFYDMIVGNTIATNAGDGILLHNDKDVLTANLVGSPWDRGDLRISNNNITGSGGSGVHARCVGTVMLSNNKILQNTYAAVRINPDRSGGRDERVQQFFAINNSMEGHPGFNLTISGVVDNGSGLARVTTSTAHRLPETHGFRADISGTTSYNGEVWCTWVSATEFDIQKSYVADETGTLLRVGWDLIVEGTTDGFAVRDLNVHGGDINSWNIEVCDGLEMIGIRAKYQRRLGADAENAFISGNNFGYTRSNLTPPGTGRWDIPLSGDFTASEVAEIGMKGNAAHILGNSSIEGNLFVDIPADGDIFRGLHDGNIRAVIKTVSDNGQIQLRDTGGSTRLSLNTDGNDSYIQQGNLVLGATAAGAKLDIAGESMRIRTAKTPASSTADGWIGEIAWDANYIYVCTAGDGPGGSTDTWERVAISTW